eukprot:s203_g39.t1
MEKARIKTAVAGDASTLVLTITDSFGEEDKQYYAVPIAVRDGGVLLAVPLGTFSPEDLQGGQTAEEEAVIGPSTVLTMELLEEDESLVVHATGVYAEVLCVDCSDGILPTIREYDPVTDSSEPIIPFSEEVPLGLPHVSASFAEINAWAESAAARTSFYSARDEPVPAPATKKAAPGVEKRGGGGQPAKRVTTAVLADQMHSLTSQMAALVESQKALQQQVSGASARDAVVPNGGGTLLAPKLPALSSSLSPPKQLTLGVASKMLGPPPKTKGLSSALGSITPGMPLEASRRATEPPVARGQLPARAYDSSTDPAECSSDRTCGAFGVRRRRLSRSSWRSCWVPWRYYKRPPKATEASDRAGQPEFHFLHPTSPADASEDVSSQDSAFEGGGSAGIKHQHVCLSGEVWELQELSRSGIDDVGAQPRHRCAGPRRCSVRPRILGAPGLGLGTGRGGEAFCKSGAPEPSCGHSGLHQRSRCAFDQEGRAQRKEARRGSGRSGGGEWASKPKEEATLPPEAKEDRGGGGLKQAHTMHDNSEKGTEIPGERAMEASLSYPKWCSRLVSSVLRSRCPFAAFLSFAIKASRKKPERLSPAPTFFPIPIPFWNVFDGMPADPGAKSTPRPSLLDKVVFVIVMALDYWHSGGGFMSVEEMQRGLNVQQRAVIRHVKALVKSEDASFSFQVCRAGRRFPELTARLSELSDFVTKTGASSQPYSKTFPGYGIQLEQDNSVMQELEPYRDLNADRLLLHGRASWDITDYLGDDLVMVYRDPRVLEFGARPSDSPIIRDSEEEVFKLAKKWDERGLLVAHFDQRGVEQPGELVRVFNTFKNCDADRQIGDRRGRNSVELRIRGPSRWLPTGPDLQDLCVDVRSQKLAISITDRKDFYHQIWVTRARALTNTVGPGIPTQWLEELSVWPELMQMQKKQKYDRRRHGDRLGEAAGPLREERKNFEVCWIAFGSVFQGDHAGVDLATQSHSQLLKDHGFLTEEQRVQAQAPLRSQVMAQGLCIDDFFCVSVEDASTPPEETQSAKMLKKAQRVYSDHGLLGSPEKDVAASDDAKVIGAQINTSVRARRYGLATLGAPLAKKLALSYVTLEICKLGFTTDSLHLCILGAWVSVLMFRRPLMSVLDFSFRLVDASRMDVRSPKVLKLPRRVIDELVLLSVLMPYAVFEISAQYHETLYATDASNSMGAAVTAFVQEYGFSVGPCIDLSRSEEYNMEYLHVVSWLCHLCAEGFLKSFVLEPPCTTFSIIRRPQLRSLEQPYGFDPGDPTTALGTLLAQSAFQVLTTGLRNEVPGLLETTYASRLRALPSYKAIRQDPAADECRTDSCRFGSQHQKPFRFLSVHMPLDHLAKRCQCERRHVRVQGVFTKASATYTEELSAEIARNLCRAMHVKVLLHEEDNEIEVEGLENQLVNQAALTEEWEALFAWKFKKPSHINILELSALLRLCVHLAAKAPHSRVVSLADSSVVRGAVSKGRTASKGLSTVLRKINAVVTAASVFLTVPYVPTRLNTADDPTREVPLRRPEGRRITEDRGEMYDMACHKGLRRWAANWVRLVLLLVGPVAMRFKDRTHAMPLFPRNAGDTQRAAWRAEREPPTVARAVLPVTATLRAKYAEIFDNWLVENDIDFALMLQHHVECIEEINLVLVKFGKALFLAGRPYNHYLETIILVVARKPLIRRMLQTAWDYAYSWVKQEPSTHHTALPFQVLLAGISVAIAWGWERVAGSLPLMWGALLRAGEFLAATRAQLMLPRDVDNTVTFGLLSIPEPKTRMTAARHQVAKLDIPDLLQVVDMAFGRLGKECRLWQGSGQTLRTRFKQLLNALSLPIVKKLGVKPPDLGSLRSGGATWLIMVTEQSDLVMRRGRWLNTKTMSIYLQESMATLYLQKVPKAAKEKVLLYAALFACYLEKAVCFQAACIPSTQWNEFVAKEVFQGSPDQTSPLNKAYVEGVHAASRALVINALLMTLTTYAIPKAIRSMGKANLWCLATLFTALLLAASLAICKTHAKDGASLWLALLGPVYGVQQTIPFLVVSEEAPKELLGELNGYLNVALCIPQLLVSLLGGAVISIVGSDTLLFGLGAGSIVLSDLSRIFGANEAKHMLT